MWPPHPKGRNPGGGSSCRPRSATTPAFPPTNDAVLAALAEARELGFLGPGPVERHVSHAAAFLPLLGDAPGPALDLGSGGGVPGLVLAAATPDREWLLLDANRRRSSFLARVIAGLGWADRVRAVRAAAEEAAHDAAFRGQYSVVVARSFAAPAVTAECAAGFLQPRGRLIVSDPPANNARPRWPAAELAAVGLAPPEHHAGGFPSLTVTTLLTGCPPGYPRPWREMQRRPLW